MKMTREEWTKEFARRMVARMEELNISQLKLAKLTGISQPCIGQYMMGKHAPTAYNLRKLCFGLAMTSSELIDF